MKAFFASLLVLVSAQLVHAGELTVGDKAPALKVASWVKGKPVTLGKGLTVVEFWATWCGPCKVSIPHLTEMAKEFNGKVDFVGVSVWENSPTDYTTKVPAFVKDMGEKMAYNVATDTTDQFMAKQWLQAAGENGIPSAFLIDPKGTVVWIGHPMVGLDKAIEANLSGKYDLKAAIAERTTKRAAQAKEEQKMAALQATLKPVIDAFRAKKWDVVLTEADKVEKQQPDAAPYLVNLRTMAMVQSNNAGLGAYLRTLMANAEIGKNGDLLNQYAWMVVEKDLKLNADAYAAACELMEKAMSLDPNNGMNMDTLALCYFRRGDKAKALATQTKAIELASKQSGVPAETLADMKKRLAKYGG